MKKVYFIVVPLLALLFTSGTVTAQTITFRSIFDSCDLSSSPTASIRYRLTVSSPASNLSLKTYFGDGTFDTISIPGEVASGKHTYATTGTYTIKHVLQLNGVGIDSVDTAYTVYCSVLSINVYGDNNTNCAWDMGEPVFQTPFDVAIDSNGFILDTITIIGSGSYKVSGPGTYNIKLLDTLPGTSAICPSNGIISLTVSSSFSSLNADFGLQCSGSGQFDLSTGVNGRFRPVSNSYIDLYAANASCNAQNAVLTLQIDSRYTYSSASTTPSTIVGNTLTWSLSNLSASQKRFFTVVVTPAVPLAIGVEICNTVTITPLSNDVNTDNNSQTTCNGIVASFDPNDKSVTPYKDIDPGTTLTYNINFENLGNDTAFNIHILDTLSKHLDASTLKVLSSSHDMTYGFLDGPDTTKIVRFEFANINLEDKNAPERNKGAVRFSIKTRSNLAPSTMIYNTAGIYFDINPVVLTNTASSRVRPTAGISGLNDAADVHIYPNPVKEKLIIKTSTACTSVKLLNNLGQILLQESLTGNETSLDLQNLPGGVYVVLLSGKNGTITRKVCKL